MSDHRAKHRMPPLLRIFSNRRLTWREGMNVLQEGPEIFISDQCVEIEDVAPEDVAAVLTRFQQTHPNL